MALLDTVPITGCHECVAMLTLPLALFLLLAETAVGGFATVAYAADRRPDPRLFEVHRRHLCHPGRARVPRRPRRPARLVSPPARDQSARCAGVALLTGCTRSRPDRTRRCHLAPRCINPQLGVDAVGLGAPARRYRRGPLASGRLASQRRGHRPGRGAVRRRAGCRDHRNVARPLVPGDADPDQPPLAAGHRRPPGEPRPAGGAVPPDASRPRPRLRVADLSLDAEPSAVGALGAGGGVSAAGGGGAGAANLPPPVVHVYHRPALPGDDRHPARPAAGPAPVLRRRLRLIALLPVRG